LSVGLAVELGGAASQFGPRVGRSYVTGWLCSWWRCWCCDSTLGRFCSWEELRHRLVVQLMEMLVLWTAHGVGSAVGRSCVTGWWCSWWRCWYCRQHTSN